MILIVDDQPANIDILIEILGDQHDVSVALCGGDVFEILEDEIPSLIFLDVVMPEVDGFEVCRRLKEQSCWKDIPVVFLSGSKSKEDVRKARDLGAASFLTKPVDRTEILKAVDQYCREDAV